MKEQSLSSVAKIVALGLIFSSISATYTQNIIADTIGFILYTMQNPNDICKAIALYSYTTIDYRNIERIVKDTVQIYCINSATYVTKLNFLLDLN